MPQTSGSIISFARTESQLPKPRPTLHRSIEYSVRTTNHLTSSLIGCRQMTILSDETYLEFRCQKCWQSNCAPTSSCGQPIACATCDAELIVPEATPERLARAEQLLKQAAVPIVSQKPATSRAGSPGENAQIENPYALPSSKSLERMLKEELQIDGYDFSNAPLASLVSRLMAVIADGIVDGLAVVAGMLLLFGAHRLGLCTLDAATVEQGSLGLEIYAIAGFPLLAVKIIQWNLIATRGQTLGKMLFFVRFVSMNGAAPGFVCGVILRNWLRYARGLIPFFGLIDIAFIFTDSRRCIHDYLAGTRVVQG